MKGLGVEGRALLHSLSLLMERETGFSRFNTAGVDGLHRVEGLHLEILAIHASRPGTGQCRRFIAEAKHRYESIAVWEIWNDDLFSALVRYGFKPASKTDPNGEKLAGLKWSR